MKKIGKLAVVPLLSIPLLTACAPSAEFSHASDAMAQIMEFTECSQHSSVNEVEADLESQVPGYTYADCHAYLNPERPSGQRIYLYVVESGGSIAEILESESADYQIQLVSDEWAVTSDLDSDAPGFQTKIFEEIKDKWGGDLTLPEV